MKLIPDEDFPLAGFDRRYFTLSVTIQLTEPPIGVIFLGILEIFQLVGIVSF